MWSDDFASPEFYTETRPKAKKSYKCCECGKAINAGEQYVRRSGKWDGEFSTYLTCTRCEHLRDLMYVKFDFACGFGGLFEDMRDAEITEGELLEEARERAGR